ncbi:MAG TPA: SDR family NAD(P)-dependent oxidoreductase, partial [Ilumatobacteraceae bacterium]|nr:SDR family NAD(P)-dependent oxidoreductase [Ilumatobacteraceae bacterium]
VVTGASRGIGEGIARRLAHAGAIVVLGARSGDEIDAVAESIRATGGHALAVPCDVTDLFSLGTLAAVAVDEFGHLDTWVNNAGGLEVCKPLTQLTRKEWHDCLAVNLTAVWDGSMAAVEQMTHGSIVNVSSLSAFLPMPRSGHYAAAKAAVNSLTRTMAHELAPDIRVNAVAPGPAAAPADVGDAIVHLASDAARDVTGEVLTIPDGFSAP